MCSTSIELQLSWGLLSLSNAMESLKTLTFDPGFQWCTRQTSCEIFFYTFCVLIIVSLITQWLGR